MFASSFKSVRVQTDPVSSARIFRACFPTDPCRYSKEAEGSILKGIAFRIGSDVTDFRVLQKLDSVHIPLTRGTTFLSTRNLPFPP